MSHVHDELPLGTSAFAIDEVQFLVTDSKSQVGPLAGVTGLRGKAETSKAVCAERAEWRLH